jgi:signal transduction histidine kinase
MQIRSRLTIQFALLVCTILLVAFCLLYFFEKQTIEEEFHKRLKEKAITSAILLLKVEEVDSTLLKTIDRSKHDILFRENISIFDQQGKEIYTNNDTIEFDISVSLLNKIRQGGEQRLSQAAFNIVGVRFKDKNQIYVILAGAIDRDGHQRLQDLKRVLLILLLLMIGIVTVAGWIYAGRALRPIKKIIVDIESISTIDLSQRLRTSNKPDEIGGLVSIFNSLLGRIENSFSFQKTFLTNVSHELKNPLTKITSQLEVTLLNERNINEYKEIIQSVLDDIKELNKLSNSLLDLASLDQTNINLSTSRVRIDEVLWEVRESVQSLNSSYKVDIHTIDMPENEEELYLDANLYLLKTALQNLIENACKFSDDNMATISLVSAKGELEIRIFDKGPGIPKEELQNIFQPFHRSNQSSKIKGHGVGLSLSQKIIAIHHGSIEIDSTLSEGTQVTVIFKTNK